MDKPWSVLRGKFTGSIYAGSTPLFKVEGYEFIGSFDTPEDARRIGATIAAFENEEFSDWIPK